MPSWIISASFVFLLLKVSKCYPTNSTTDIQYNGPSRNVFNPLERITFAKNISNQLIKKSKLIRSGRQDEDDNELPEIVPEILKIVGSALAGNASSLIDNSISLLPEGVSDTISGAINVLINTINSVRPTQAPVETTQATQKTEVTVKSVTVADTITSTQTVKTTNEDEEDYEEDKTTEASDLRTNSTNATSMSPSSQLVTIQPLSVVNVTSQPLQIVTPLIVGSTVTPLPEETLSPSNLDPDNKANWISLIGNSQNGSFSSSQSPVDYIDTDNKANWESLLPPVPQSMGIVNESLTSSQNSEAVMNNTLESDILALIMASIIKLNKDQIKIRDNGKAPGQNILTPTTPTKLNLMETMGSLREKLVALLQSQSETKNKTNNLVTSLPNESFTSQLLQIIGQHKGNDQVKVVIESLQSPPTSTLNSVETPPPIKINSNSSTINSNGVPLYGGQYASGFVHGVQSGNAILTLTTTTEPTPPPTTEDEDEDEDEDS